VGKLGSPTVLTEGYPLSGGHTRLAKAIPRRAVQILARSWSGQVE
jgi:hypothetical protein